MLTYYKIDIDKVEERYEIYRDGKIFDKKRRKYCKKYLDSKGYHKVWIANIGKGIYVHRLVLCKYIPAENQVYLQVNHKNGIKTDNNLENLEWCTQSENQIHAFENGLNSRRGIKNPQSKLNESDVIEIIDKLLKEVPIEKIAIEYNVSKSLISRIKTKRAWVYLTKDIEFPCSKFSNIQDSKYKHLEDNLMNDLQDGIDINVLSEKYHLSKRYIRDFKYRKLGVY